MNKKSLVFGLVISLIFINLASVSAYNGFNLDIRQGSETLIDFVVDFAEPFLQIILGGEDYTGLLLFERFLLFILILSLVYISLKNIDMFEDQRAVLWTVSVIIPLIAVRFMNFEWINAVIMQYQILGIALTAFLPFIIYLFFLHNITDSGAVRKIGWAFFIVIYFGLWATIDSEIYGEIYFWTIIAAILFMVFDNVISDSMEKQRFREAERSVVIDSLNKLAKRRRDLESNTGIPEKEKRKQRRYMDKQERDLQRQLRRVNRRILT